MPPSSSTATARPAATAATAEHVPAPPRLERLLFWLLFGAGLARAVWLLAHSTGSAMDDEIGHFLLSRDSGSDPTLIFSFWGRTLQTLLYAPVAPLGLAAARCLSLAMTCAAMALTWRIGRGFGLRHLYLLPLFFWFQPWLLRLSFTCLTEVPFLLFLVAALACHASKRWLATGLLIGCLPLIRHEGVGLVAAWLAWAALTRRPRLAVGLLIPYAAYAATFAAALGHLPFSLFQNSRPTGDAYGAGSWLHFFPPLIASAGITLLPAIYGMPRLLRTPTGALLSGTCLLYLAMHVVLFHFGMFGSGGYVEFLLPLAPWLALAAVAGVDALDERVRAHGALSAAAPWVPRALRAAFTALMIVVTAALGIARTQPYVPQPVQQAMLDAAQWLRDQRLADRRIEAAHVWLYYALPRRMPEPLQLAVDYTPLADLPAGTLVVWDGRYAEFWGRPKAQLERPPWRRLAAFGQADDVIVFERT